MMAQSPLSNPRKTLPVKRTSSGGHRLATCTSLPARLLDVPGTRLNTPVSPEFQKALQAVATHALDEGFSLADTKSLLDIAHNEGTFYCSRCSPLSQLTGIA